MTRRANGAAALDEARALLKTAKTADELRAAQAVVFPLDFGLSLTQTALALGRSPGTVARLRGRFITGKEGGKMPLKRGGSRRQILSPELAEELAVKALSAYYRKGWDAKFIDEFKKLIELHHGRPVGMSTVYRLYSRAVRERLHALRLEKVTTILR